MDEAPEVPDEAPSKPKKHEGGRAGLLGSIEGFKKGKLKKATTNDRSAPILDGSGESSAPASTGGGLFPGGIPKLPGKGPGSQAGSLRVPLNIKNDDEGSRKGSTQSNVDDWSTDDKPKEKKKPAMPSSTPKAAPGRMPAANPAKKFSAPAPKAVVSDAPPMDADQNSDNSANGDSASSEEAPPVPVRAAPKRAAAPTRTPNGTMRGAPPTRAAPKFTPQPDEPSESSEPVEDGGSERNSRSAPPVPKRRPSMSAPKTNGPPPSRRFNAPRKV
jgi:WAS/WASL-interacting protein